MIPFLLIALAVAISSMRTLAHPDAHVLGGTRHVAIAVAGVAIGVAVLGIAFRVFLLLGKLALMRSASFIVLLVCSCSLSRGEDPVATQGSAIGYGTADATHTAVVSLLGSQQGGFTECTGSIVQLKNGKAYVLTAAHCCNTAAPTLVVMSNDYTLGEQYLVDSGMPQPPVYSVTPGSVWYDTKFNNIDHDFCMLEFAAPANSPVLALPAGSDGLSLGTAIETVGFGVTDSNANNSLRRHGTSTLDLSLTTNLIQASAGGGTHIPGACEGDSGGPILVAAGAAQSAQFVVGVASYGNGQTCAQNTQATASRVTSELGTGGFITSYLADTPIGTNVGGTQADGGAPDAAATDASSDATTTNDAAIDAPADAPVASDAGSENEPASSGGCSTSSAPTSSRSPIILALFALAFAGLRRAVKK